VMWLQGFILVENFLDVLLSFKDLKSWQQAFRSNQEDSVSSSYFLLALCDVMALWSGEGSFSEYPDLNPSRR
jgi:hypothetical protein